MSERAFITYLDETRENRYRHWHSWDRGKIIEFRIQYEALISGHWHSVVRYDSAHGQPHRDRLHPDGTQTKDWFPSYSNAEVLTIGQRDIRENWPKYRAQYEKEMQG
ncbi:MAG TPA: hypothetical protein VFL17_09865 [Anaerolineae bacterium]|nr:hypothetical protein [Anaerolineae bacterium]